MDRHFSQEAILMVNKFMKKLHVFWFGCNEPPKVDQLVASWAAQWEELQVTKRHLHSPASVDGYSCS